MKSGIKYILIAFSISVTLSSCESYLGQSNKNVSEQEIIYRNYNSMLGFLDNIYSAPLLVNILQGNYGNETHPGGISDEMATIANSSSPIHFVTSGNWLESKSKRFEIGVNGETIISKSYQGLRICNRVINDIDKVQVITPEQRASLLGQAHFLRAHFYFELIKRYGGMPIFDKLLSASDNLDLPRKTYLESSDWMMADLDKAIEYLPKEWPVEQVGRPTKISALALKSMAMLYAASPLMQNNLDVTEKKPYNTERAKQAAIAAQTTIDSIDTHPYYKLTPAEQYRSIFLLPGANMFAQPEQLWYTRHVLGNRTAWLRKFFITQPFENLTGAEGTPYCAPTQNMVDLFEKKGSDGKYYPISDPQSGYSLNQPYTDRDPRFTNNIIVPGEAWSKDLTGKQVYVPTYYGGYSPDFISTNTLTNERQQTGYMCKKFLWPEANNRWQGTAGLTLYRPMSVHIRIAQVYLDLAEASFEATGSATAIVPGCKMSAVEALNIIRNRAGIGNLPDAYVNDPAKFRQAYRRERAVELMFEHHRWFDIRRWMIFDEVFVGQSPIKGIKATPINHSYTDVQLKSEAAMYYKFTNFNFEVINVTSEVRNYSTRNYWYPFPMDDVANMNNLKQNPGW